MEKGKYFLGLARLVLGWMFLWAFLDKVFGWGFTTAADKSWLSGVSPTAGFLKFGTHGPFAGFYQSLAGSAWVDWLFMLGLLFLGLALMLGLASRLAGYLGALLMLILYLGLVPPEHNPVVDEHIVYALLLLTVATSDAGTVLGFGKWWSETRLVKAYPVLR